MAGVSCSRRGFLAAAALGAAGCRMSGTSASGRCLASSRDYSLQFSQGRYRMTMPVASSDGPARVWIIGDTHFGFHDKRDDAYAGNYARMAQWPGKPEPFEKLLRDAVTEKVDRLILVGDIISFPTLANVEYLKTRLDACGVPWTYVAGNHDWHFEGDAGSDLDQRARWIEKRLKPLYQGANPLMASVMVKGVRFVMIDNSAYHLLPGQVDFWQREAAKGDPICLAMHIPFWQPGWGVCTCACPTWGAKTDPYWEIERRERWAEKPSEATFAFRDAVLATPNLAAVFAGHHHVFQCARANGQNLFTTPSCRKGEVIDVTFAPSV